MKQEKPDTVYINRLAKFLPNDPISNDQMEEYLGMVDGTPSKAKPIILRNNKIKTRYYALDKNGNSTHSNTELTVEAIRGLFDEDFTADDIDLLSCGTTSPDQLLPSHTSMVHGALMNKAVEILSPAGSCCAGMHAMRYAYLSILAGERSRAVCAGSEKLSSWMLAKNFRKEPDKHDTLKKKPIVAFEKDFLRWMLSDGAGAALLSPEPNKEGHSLKIEWIEGASFANKLETCMYAGGEKTKDGGFKGWRDYPSEDILNRTLFSLRQDVDLLGENIVPVGNSFFLDIAERRDLDVKDIDWFLPHLSSEFFRKRIEDELIKNAIPIPQEKWFTNLTKLGNVGAASIYFMLEELFNSDRLKKGDTILCMVPESARFSYVYVYLTVV
ncbi:MAG: beta-ketoacyl-ACP synthase III [Bacteroidales bacterium]|jgi:3-oxoacyl-[acyl-carrier-protein] synthase-3|nr:beta-ketoacyl-ACP synthase III [Bacteroidales bacterium]